MPEIAQRRTRAGGHETAYVDSTWERAAILNQLLLGGIVVIVALMKAMQPADERAGLFFAGVITVFLLTGVTFLVPWNQIPRGWLAVIPTLDIFAIAAMRIAEPTGSLGLLWVFPAMWLGGGFGLIGLAGVVVGVIALVFRMVLTMDTATQQATVLLPLAILAVGTSSYLNSRRSDAQRALLDKQSRLLRGVLEVTRRQEQEVTEVLDAVDFGVIRIRPDGRIAVTNDAHARLQIRPDPTGDSELTAFRDDGVSPLPLDELPVERAKRGESFDGQIVWFGTDPGPRLALSVSARRLTDGQGADAGAVVVSRDVTRELTALRARDELVASVSHELRTPLTSILGYLDLAIEDPEIPDQVRANLDIAERNAERLLRIVADILAASSTSASVASALSPRTVDAEALARSAIEAMRPDAASRAITLDASGLEAAGAWADPLRLRQVVDNLLSNAIKYNRDGGTVFVGTTSDGDATWILVRDTGVGISDEERAHLFQRYYKAGAARRAGTGLGLAITRDIVRAHGGEIAVRSAVGVGSTFIVKLPAREQERQTQ